MEQIKRILSIITFPVSPTEHGILGLPAPILYLILVFLCVLTLCSILVPIFYIKEDDDEEEHILFRCHCCNMHYIPFDRRPIFRPRLRCPHCGASKKSDPIRYPHREPVVKGTPRYLKLNKVLPNPVLNFMRTQRTPNQQPDLEARQVECEVVTEVVVNETLVVPSSGTTSSYGTITQTHIVNSNVELVATNERTTIITTTETNECTPLLSPVLAKCKGAKLVADPATTTNPQPKTQSCDRMPLSPPEAGGSISLDSAGNPAIKLKAILKKQSSYEQGCSAPRAASQGRHVSFASDIETKPPKTPQPQPSGHISFRHLAEAEVKPRKYANFDAYLEDLQRSQPKRQVHPETTHHRTNAHGHSSPENAQEQPKASPKISHVHPAPSNGRISAGRGEQRRVYQRHQHVNVLRGMKKSASTNRIAKRATTGTSKRERVDGDAQKLVRERRLCQEKSMSRKPNVTISQLWPNPLKLTQPTEQGENSREANIIEPEIWPNPLRLHQRIGLDANNTEQATQGLEVKEPSKPGRCDRTQEEVGRRMTSILDINWNRVVMSDTQDFNNNEVYSYQWEQAELEGRINGIASRTDDSADT